MNTILRIKLYDVEDVKNFVKRTNDLKCEVVVKSGKYSIDGKSIMGIFSLDLSKVLDVNLIGEHTSEDVKTFDQWISRD